MSENEFGRIVWNPSRIIWALPGAVIMWIYFTLNGKRLSFSVVSNEKNIKYNVLFSFLFYAIIIILILLLKC